MLTDLRSIALLSGLLACTPASRGDASDPTSTDAPPTRPLAVHAPDAERSPTRRPAPPLRDLVHDLAVVLPTGTIVQESAQCLVGASWVAIADAQDEPPDVAGMTLHVVDARGTAETTMPPTRALEVTSQPRLATRAHAPSARARLGDRWLDPRVPDRATVVAWARAKIRKPLEVVGQIAGKFGDDVDRIVVLAPLTLPTVEDDAFAWQVSEVAVLVVGDTPTGLLPFTRTFEGKGEEFEPGIHGMQVAGVVDLDGDGIEEVLWSSHRIVEELLTQVHLSYFADGEHHVHELSSCTYWGCNVVLPREHCRGPVKPRR